MSSRWSLINHQVVDPAFEVWHAERHNVDDLYLPGALDLLRRYVNFAF